jgi:hemerythrin
MLIDDFDARFVLGVPAMDRSHRELVDLLNRMDESSNAAFAYLFPDLLQHTRAHFAVEEVLMRDSAFPAESEHKAEHARILVELQGFAQRVAEGRLSLARAFVHERIPGWFANHLDTMDGALAAHLSSRRQRRAQPA